MDIILDTTTPSRSHCIIRARWSMTIPVIQCFWSGDGHELFHEVLSFCLAIEVFACQRKIIPCDSEDLTDGITAGYYPSCMLSLAGNDVDHRQRLNIRL